MHDRQPSNNPLSTKSDISAPSQNAATKARASFIFRASRVQKVIHVCTVTEKNDVESICDWSFIFIGPFCAALFDEYGRLQRGVHHVNTKGLLRTC